MAFASNPYSGSYATGTAYSSNTRSKKTGAKIPQASSGYQASQPYSQPSSGEGAPSFGSGWTSNPELTSYSDQWKQNTGNFDRNRMNEILSGVNKNNWEQDINRVQGDLASIGVGMQRASDGQARGRLFLPGYVEGNSNYYDPFKDQGWAMSAAMNAKYGGGGGGSVGSGSGFSSQSSWSPDPRSAALYNTLMGRSQQSLKFDAKDPIIAAQVNAFGANQQRASRNYLDQLAEQQGPNANLGAEKRMASERVAQATGGMLSELMGREVSARRDEIQNALSQMGSLLSDEQRLTLQNELAKLENTQFQQNLGLNAENLASEWDWRRRGQTL